MGLKARNCSSEVALHPPPPEGGTCLFLLYTAESMRVTAVIEPGVFWSTSLASFSSLTARSHVKAGGEFLQNVELQ